MAEIGTGKLTPSIGDLASGDNKAGALTKAKLDLHEPPRSAGGNPGALIDTIKFQFNPSTLKISRAAGWNTDKQRNSPSGAGMPQYSGNTSASDISLVMLIDATDKMDSSCYDAVDKLLSTCWPTAKSKQDNKPSPPWVKLIWGDKLRFDGYISKVDVEHKLFTPTGVPVRSSCTIVFHEIRVEPPKTNPTSGALHHTRTHRMVAGDTPQSLAYNMYGRAGRYRDIMAANDVDNPMAVKPGTVLAVPSDEEIAYG